MHHEEFSSLNRWTKWIYCAETGLATLISHINVNFTQILIQTKTFLKNMIEIKVLKHF